MRASSAEQTTRTANNERIVMCGVCCERQLDLTQRNATKQPRNDARSIRKYVQCVCGSKQRRIQIKQASLGCSQQRFNSASLAAAAAASCCSAVLRRRLEQCSASCRPAEHKTAEKNTQLYVAIETEHYKMNATFHVESQETMQRNKQNTSKPEGLQIFLLNHANGLIFLPLI